MASLLDTGREKPGREHRTAIQVRDLTIGPGEGDHFSFGFGCHFIAVSFDVVVFGLVAIGAVGFLCKFLAGSISNWRETWHPTELGDINNGSIASMGSSMV